MLDLSKNFSKENVEKLNKYQQNEFVHPFTCGNNDCKRTKENYFGVLIATEDGWICPCCDYKQNWFYTFMLTYSNFNYEDLNKQIYE